jgi:hypothetical protein
MPYPNSFDVVDGMPTAYQHYNNLRGDALRFGQAEANAVNVGAMMGLYQTGMQLEILEPNRIRLVASAAAPASLVIGGYPLQVVASVDLAAGSAPSGIAADYYIFAVRSDGLTGFSLDVNTTPTETSTRRIIGRCYWNGTKIVKETVRSMWQAGLYGGGVAAQVAGGRLTLVSGNPVADAGASATVFYTPYTSGRIGLYVVGFGWRVYSFSQASLALAGLAIGNYDIFGYNISGEGYALTLEAVKWTTDIARATAVVQQDGVWVKNGAPERRYLGTIRLYGVATTIDSLDQRFVWNAENRVPRMVFKQADAVSWTYLGGGVWRMANASAANRAEVVVGLDDAWVDIDLSTQSQLANGTQINLGIGLDNAVDAPYTASPTAIVGHYYSNSTVLTRATVIGRTWGRPGIGYHYYQWMEMSNGGTATVYGQQTVGNHGLNGIVLG